MIPPPLTVAARVEAERFQAAYQEQLERARVEVALTILVWGPGINSTGPVAAKRLEIRDVLRELGHNAIFSEDLSEIPIDAKLSEKSKEFAQALSAHQIVVLVENSPGALGETHDFVNHPDLFHKILVMVPLKYKDGYSAGGALKDHEDAGGGVYWYKEGELEACEVRKRAVTRVEALRQIIFRARLRGAA